MLLGFHHRKGEKDGAGESLAPPKWAVFKKFENHWFKFWYFFYLLGPLLKTTYLPFLVLSFLFNLRILAACHVVGI